LAYLLDLAEVVVLVVIGIVLYEEHVRLRSYFATQLGGGVGSDVFMLAIFVSVVASAIAYGVVRTRAWLRSPSRSIRVDTSSLNELRRPALVFACVILYAALIPVAGYVLSSLLFFALFSRLDSNRLLTNVTFGVSLAVAFYLVFEVLFGTPFPRGFLFP
jgi:hypothetical protein